MSESAPSKGALKRFGTFGGVYTPSVLTILGVIMYLRLGWVTGEVGLGGALLIVAISHLISLATGLSVSAIATDRKVGVGGAYFMISRAFGSSSGGAIGIPLFMAQALSVTFYIVGFTETVVQLFSPSLRALIEPWMISTVVNVILCGISMKSAALAIKAQYVVMAMIVVSLVGFFTGTTPEFPQSIEWFHDGDESFGAVFAVFFPAVTGIMAGVGMSGDLKDPRQSIPRGTLMAIATGFVIYMIFPIWLALNASNEFLIANMDAAFQIASVPALIYLGVWGATLSSALGSILTAPRTLQALAQDGIVPRFLGRGAGPENEPRIGTLVTFGLAQAGIMLGDLDSIAPVLTMFFLATYGFTNLASGLQQWAASPGFRPSFRVPVLVSFLGALSCFYVMSYIDLLAMFVALFVCGLIFLVVQRRRLAVSHGDARHGIWAAVIRMALLRLRGMAYHPLNWRPNLIVLGGNPNKRSYLLELGDAIAGEGGLVTYFHLLRGEVCERAQLRRELFSTFDELLSERYPHVLYRVDIAQRIYRGAVTAAQSYGVGSFEANTVMLGWPKKPERALSYVNMLNDLITLDRSVFLVRFDEERAFGERREIHIWWGGLQGNGALMLLLPLLLKMNYAWRQARVTVLTVVEREAQVASVEATLTDVLDAARLEATPRVLVKDHRALTTVMREESGGADLAILGLRLPDAQDQAIEAFFDRVNALLTHLPTTILVRSAQNFEGTPVLFDASQDTSST